MIRRAVLGCLFVFAHACAFDVQPCSGDEDCLPGSRCARPAGTSTHVCLAPDEEQPGRDAGTHVDPTDDGVDPVPWPDQGSPNNMDGDDCPTIATCGAAEPNDTEDTAFYLSDFAEGCGRFGLEEWAVIHQDSVCAGDVDQFIIEYVACERSSYRLAISLTTPDTCTIGGDLRIEEGLYDCSNQNVRCETVDGAERITIIVRNQPDPQPVESIRFAVRPGLALGGVDYILRATITR